VSQAEVRHNNETDDDAPLTTSKNWLGVPFGESRKDDERSQEKGAAKGSQCNLSSHLMVGVEESSARECAEKAKAACQEKDIPRPHFLSRPSGKSRRSLLEEVL